MYNINCNLCKIVHRIEFGLLISVHYIAKFLSKDNLSSKTDVILYGDVVNNATGVIPASVVIRREVNFEIRLRLGMQMLMSAYDIGKIE